MNITCFFGAHKWTGCKCPACGKTRDEGHDWSGDCERCARCGAERKNAHTLNGCVCSVCGATRHNWSKDSDGCTRCGKQIEISTLAELHGIGRDLAGHYRLVADIDTSATAQLAAGKGFLPIGWKDDPFTGVLDGNGHTISNLHINRGDMGIVGLFGYLNSGRVFNLNVVDAHIVGKLIAGILVGYSSNGCITNCRVSGVVAAGSHVGGLVGWCNTDGSITQCHASAELTGNALVGGLVGLNEGVPICDCKASGKISVFGDNSVSVGGLVGLNKKGAVKKCLTSGEVSGASDVGGLIGSNDGGSEIDACEFVGKVSGDHFVGGLVGSNEGSAIIASQASCEVSAISHGAGGLVGHNDGDIKQSRASGRASGDWDIGGLVGWNGGSIAECQNSGEVSGKSSVGGLVGRNEKGRIGVCLALGKVSGFGLKIDIGGLVGLKADNDSITQSYWDIQATGQQESKGGEGKSTSELKQRATFVGWNFDKVWQIEENKTYPALRCLATPN